MSAVQLFIFIINGKCCRKFKLQLYNNPREAESFEVNQGKQWMLVGTDLSRTKGIIEIISA